MIANSRLSQGERLSIHFGLSFTARWLENLQVEAHTHRS
jgi:hypothetical protein